MENKNLQKIFVYGTPESLPFISLVQITGLEKDRIYVVRGIKCEKAIASEFDYILETKSRVLFKETSEMELEEHLKQLKILFSSYAYTKLEREKAQAIICFDS